MAPSARCPVCGRDSRRVHSIYARTISDLARCGVQVVLRLRARRFFCDEPSCKRRIFCERLPDLTAHARKTGRLEEALLLVAFELSSRASARLAAELGMFAGRDALLRRVRSAPLTQTGGVRV